MKNCFFKIQKINKFFLTLVFYFIFLQNTHAEYITFSEFNFCMDLPEGFELIEASQTGDSFFFETKSMPVKFALKFCPTEKYSTPKNALEDTLNQLNAKGAIEKIDWYGRECFLTTFSFVMPDQKLYTGWAFCIQVPLINDPSTKSNILFLTYADNQISRDCDQFMLSIIDSVFFCQEDFRRPGPVTTFAFPKSTENEIILTIGGKKIISSIDNDAITRSQFVIDREYAVLKIYANHKAWKEAWQRYYRQIFRESYSSLKKMANDIYKALLPIAQKKSFLTPQEEILKMLLDWVQDFEYKRDRSNSDFTAVTASVQGVGCDCDSRSLLMCILMEHMGIKSELFISREYSHAIFGLALNKKGALINVDGTDFILGETTAKVDFGLIAKEHRDTNKWIPVDLP